jgi:hypothetical protein
MEPTRVGDLVTVEGTGRDVSGIVFDLPSPAKAIVAVIDRKRGPVLRTFDVKALSERTEETPEDHALRLLVRRSAASGRGSADAGQGGVSGRAGHTRGASHRTTGK